MITLGHMFYPPADTHEYMLTRGFVSKDVSVEDMMEEIMFFSNLEQSWEPIAKENEDLIYDYYQANWYKQGMEEENGPFFTYKCKNEMKNN